MNNFGNMLASRRKELRMTQKELALKLNVSDKTISKWETGMSYPEVTMLSTIAKVLEMNVNEFFDVEDLQEKKIDLEEHKSYDDNIINKYKNRNFISMALIIVGYIFLLSVGVIENGDMQYLMIVLGLISEALALFNFISNNISFRSFYSNKFYTRKYDHTFYIFSTITILAFASLFVVFPLVMQASFNLFIIQGIFTIVSMLLVAISYFIIIKIARLSNFKIKWDLKNKILIAFTILFGIALIIVMGINYRFSKLISLLYILIYVIILRRDFVKK